MSRAARCLAHDMHGLAAAAGIVTARGGPASHAAVVARAMGKPAVVGVSDLTVDVADAAVRAGGHTVPEGTLITIDGTGGEVVLVGSQRDRTPQRGACSPSLWLGDRRSASGLSGPVPRGRSRHGTFTGSAIPGSAPRSPRFPHCPVGSGRAR